jgi:hypothetical protein
MVMCSECGVTAHLFPVEWERKIFQKDELEKLSCFEIVRHKKCIGLWLSKNVGVQHRSEGGRRMTQYRVLLLHPIYQELQMDYGIMPRYTRMRGVSNEERIEWAVETGEDDESDHKGSN